MEDVGKPSITPQTLDGDIPDTEEIYKQIADRVRTDSTVRRQLTSLEWILPLTPEPRKIHAYLDAMTKTEVYKDIKLIFGANRSMYLYSENGVTRRSAERLALDEEVRSRIVSHVRGDSRNRIKLTAIDKIGILIPGAEADKIDNHLALLLGDDRYKDIIIVTNSRGNRYLYSNRFLTSNYAELLVRAEASDPLASIAATVRDDSRIYPRPTNLEVFKTPVFKIDSDRLERYASELTGQPEYKDIKLIKAPTGAIYLYSDLYLNSCLAEATVEWEEVGRYENP